jgi:hypothetical protein
LLSDGAGEALQAVSDSANADTAKREVAFAKREIFIFRPFVSFV